MAHLILKGMAHLILLWTVTEINLCKNVVINLIFEIYTKFASIWCIECCVWTDEREQERSLSGIERS